MNERELSSIRKKLQEKKQDLLKIVSHTSNASLGEAEVGDEADVASSSLEKEITFELNDNERVMLDNIESALTKMEKGTFGLCESCKSKIPVNRLNAMPFARYCIDCQSNNEKHKV